MAVPARPTLFGHRNVTANSFEPIIIANDNSIIKEVQARISLNAIGSDAYNQTVGYNAPPGVTGLSRYTKYYYKIRVRNNDGWSDYSTETDNVTTLRTVPSATNPYYIDAQGQTGIHYLFHGVNDNGGSPIRDYEVSYGTDPNNAQASFTLGNGDTFITGLARYTLYYVWSRAQNEIGWGPRSVRFEQRTRAYLPAPPSPVALDNVTQTSAHYVFRGEDNGGADILEWQVGYGTDPNNVQTIIGSNGDSWITGLAPYTTYYFWARGRNVEGWSGWSSRSQTRTQAGALVFKDGAFHDAIPYVKEGGAWRVARPFIKRVGLWKSTS